MNATAIASALNYIDDEFITDAATSNTKALKFKSKQILVAAVTLLCFTACITAAISLFNFKDKKEQLFLGINNDSGMGFEGWFFSDLSQAENGNPWNENTKIKNLPVYENNIFDENGIACALNEFEQINRLTAAAEILGINLGESDYQYVKGTFGEIEKEYLSAVIYQNSTATIISNAGGTVSVNFNTQFDLSDNQITKLAEHFFGTGQTTEATLQSYNVYGKVSTEHRFFTGEKDTEKIISYNLRYISARTDTEGETSVVITDNLIKQKEIGFYPIITLQEAKKLLLNGSYITSQIQYEFPGEDYIVKAELVYRCGKDESIAPYYLFYVELPLAPSENGLKNYGAYYVPAIEAEYIADFPLYNGIYQ